MWCHQVTNQGSSDPFGSTVSLNVDRLAKKNENRLKRLRDLQGRLSDAKIPCVETHFDWERGLNNFLFQYFSPFQSVYYFLFKQFIVKWSNSCSSISCVQGMICLYMILMMSWTVSCPNRPTTGKLNARWGFVCILPLPACINLHRLPARVWCRVIS